MNSIKPKLKARQQLYFQKYLYAINLESIAFRYLDRLDLTWIRNHSVNRYPDPKSIGLDTEIIYELASALRDAERDQKDFKCINSYLNRYYYTNNPKLINRLQNLPAAKVVSYAQADPILPTDAVVLSRSNYKYRTFLKDRPVQKSDAYRLLNFIDNQGLYMRINLAARRRIESGAYRYPLYGKAFIDHQSPVDPTMIEMVLPGIIRKTLPIMTK